MMPAGLPPSPEPDPGALLRERGLRVTPQRRAILSAFGGAAAEHLSADEVHARASSLVPEISRGTVYAALAELTELGLLAAVGSPEPVRYETNTADHQHFRCRLCLRLYDVDVAAPRVDALRRRGFVVERTTVVAEGICADCADYDEGLRAGAAAAVAPAPVPGALDLPVGSAASSVESPLGPVLLAATPAGLVRAVYEDHHDAPALRALARSRRGGAAARGHLADASALVTGFFGHAEGPAPACAVDWAALDPASTATLRAVQDVRPGADRSYEQLAAGDAGASARGLALGTNPLAIVVPCHRVTRGREVPDAYVGGPQRKRWLRQHER
jgi:O-6-methylguanine DNA methyltransferase